MLSWYKAPEVPLRFEIRKNSAAGELLGSGVLRPGQSTGNKGKVPVMIKSISGRSDLHIQYKAGGQAVKNVWVNGVEFEGRK